VWPAQSILTVETHLNGNNTSGEPLEYLKTAEEQEVSLQETVETSRGDRHFCLTLCTCTFPLSASSPLHVPPRLDPAGPAGDDSEFLEWN
jgi:hypothetical protein